jgi:hypothetical protein
MTLATLSGCGRHQPPLVVLTLYHPRFFLFVFLCFQKHVVWKKDGKRDGSVILEPPHSHLTSPTTTIPVRQLSVVDTTFLSSLFSHHSWLRTLNSPTYLFASRPLRGISPLLLVFLGPESFGRANKQTVGCFSKSSDCMTARHWEWRFVLHWALFVFVSLLDRDDS